jgi:hypothetical protein
MYTGIHQRQIMSSFKADSSVKTVDCGECSYCTRKCCCPGCNGYSNWGECGGCKSPISQPSPLSRQPHVEPEIFIPHGGPEGVGVEPIPDCRWEACGGTRLPTNSQEDGEDVHVSQMSIKYGLSDYYQIKMPCYNGINYEFQPLILSPGEFWYFYTEDSAEDTPTAKNMRLNTQNTSIFETYLRDKYGMNWLHITRNTDENCPYLWRRRTEKEWEEERQQYEQEEEEQAWKKEFDEKQAKKKQKENEMREKLEKDEITRAEFNDFFYSQDDSDYEDDL